MKRLLSTIVSALVAVSFAGMVWAVDTPSSERNTSTSDPRANMPAGAETDSTAAPMKETKKTTKKKKRRSTKKSRKHTKGTGTGAATGTEPNYGTPATGGPSGTMEGGAGAGGAGTGGAGR